MTHTCTPPAPLHICESHPLPLSHHLLPSPPCSHPSPAEFADFIFYRRCDREADRYTSFFPHRAHILLHEPHAKPDAGSCVSSRKTLNASRAILELMYVLAATNYDVSLLDLQAFVCRPLLNCAMS